MTIVRRKKLPKREGKMKQTESGRERKKRAKRL